MMAIAVFLYRILPQFMLTPLTKAIWLAAICILGIVEILLIHGAYDPMKKLKCKATQLADSILTFVSQKVQGSPPFEIKIDVPLGTKSPASLEELIRNSPWRHRFEAYEKNAIEEYEARFSRQVEELKDSVSDMGLEEGELAPLYKHPTNLEEIRIIGQHINQITELID